MIAPILKKYTINEFTVCASFSFCNEIRKQVLFLYMATFHIRSLFSNFPLDETIDICLNRVFQHKKKIKGMLKRDFKQLLTLPVKCCCIFNKKYYKQANDFAIILC